MSQLEYNGKTIEIPDLKQGEQELDTLDGFPGLFITIEFRGNTTVRYTRQSR